MAKNTTVTIDEDLLQQARNLNINISSAAEKRVRAEVRSLEEKRLEHWRQQQHSRLYRRIDYLLVPDKGYRRPWANDFSRHPVIRKCSR